MGRVALFLLVSSAAWANFPGQVARRLDVNATSMTVTNSGTGSHTETINFAVGSGERARVSISMNDVPPPAGTSYTDCADPCSVSINMNYGDVVVEKELLNSSGNPFTPPKKARHVIPQVMIPCVVAGSWKLPVEVIGQTNYKTCVQFNATSPPTSNLLLHLRLNNSGYQQLMRDSAGYVDWSTKLAVQICQGSDRTGTCTAWLQVNNTNTTAEDSCKWFAYDYLHCIGGVNQTIEISRTLPNNALANGTNNITFRFNGTDGITSGLRVLEWAILDSSTRKTMTQIAVASNVATPTTSANHNYSNGNDVFLEQAPGMRGRFNGLRTITAIGSATTFSFTPCGSGPGFYVISGGCTSPNGTYEVPLTRATGATLTFYPQTAQQAMYVTKVVAPAISTLVYDDPTTWTAGPGNAANGHTLFTTAVLATPNNPQLATPNVNHADVHCSSCHTDDTPWGGQAGSDLKIFNYSNWSIKNRSIFHLLSDSDADDIVAYIRSISTTVPAMARPWNPPQLPAPGLDSLPLVNWDAGGGIDAVLTYDCDVAEYMTGVAGCNSDLSAGTFTNWVYTSKMNLRELPLPYQPIPWNAWLPTIHPKDAFPDHDFYASTAYDHYQDALTAVTAQTANSYTTNLALFDWNQQVLNFQNVTLGSTYAPIGQEKAGYWRPDNNLALFSLYQWAMVKLFEVMHPTLEGYCAEYYTALYGARPSGSYDSRCWKQDRFWFNFTYHIATEKTHHTTLLDASRYPKPTGMPGSINDSVWSNHGNQAYVMSAVNACNYHEVGQVTRDIGYYVAFLQGAGIYTPGVLYPLMISILSSAQCGVDYGLDGGADLSSDLIRSFGSFEWGYLSAVNWMWTSEANQTTLFTKKALFLQSIADAYTVTEWRTFLTAKGDTCSGAGVTSAWGGANPISICDNLAGFLAVANYFGADSTALSNLASWGDSIVNGSVWPGHDFTADDLGAMCSLVDVSGGAMALYWPKCANMP